MSSDLGALAGYTEFLFVGSGVQAESKRELFTSAGDAQELYCHMDAGYDPLEFVFGNVAYSVGAVRGLVGTLRTIARGEIKEFSDVFNETRHQALGADQVVGVKTYIVELGASLIEVFSVGTAVCQLQGPKVMTQALPAQAIIRDRDTWVNGAVAFDTTQIRAGEK